MSKSCDEKNDYYKECKKKCQSCGNLSLIIRKSPGIKKIFGYK